MNITILFVATITLSVITLILLLTTLRLHKRLKNLLEGEHGRSLEKVIHDLITDVRTLENKSSKEETKLETLLRETRAHTRAPQMIRYKALESNNSNQSFSLALVDSNGNGSVMTSLHIRDRVSVYAKNVRAWKSDLELTEEEQRALALVQKEISIE